MSSHGCDENVKDVDSDNENCVDFDNHKSKIVRMIIHVVLVVVMLVMVIW